MGSTILGLACDHHRRLVLLFFIYLRSPKCLLVGLFFLCSTLSTGVHQRFMLYNRETPGGRKCLSPSRTDPKDLPTGQAWSSPSPRGQCRTVRNGGNWL